MIAQNTRDILDDQDRATLETVSHFPAWEPQRDGESLLSYGARILCYILAFSVTSPLTDRDLEHADHAAIVAICSHDMSDTARANISATRHIIASLLRGRRAQLLQAERDKTLNHDVTPEPNGGTRVPTHPAPAPIVPSTSIRQPVDIQF